MQRHKLRTTEVQEAYDIHKSKHNFAEKCPLCEIPSTKEFTHWRIIESEYPYDRITQRHDLLLPKRHTTLVDLTSAELAELLYLRTEILGDTYEHIMENLPKHKSVPGHCHLHLLVIKDEIT